MNNNYLSLRGSKSNTSLLALFILLFIPALLPAQAVLQRESFESTIFPAPGWRQIKLSSNLVAAFSRQPVATATNPAVAAPAGGGSNVMMLNSFSAGSSAFPDTAVMVTKPFDFSNNAGVNPDFKISVYRESAYSTQDDHIAVYINTSPSLSGATLLTHNAGANKIPRFSGAFPAVTSGTWNQYTYTLPAATYSGKRYYFIIAGVAKAGNNTYIDLCDVNTYPTATNISDVSFNFFLQNGASGSLGGTNHMIVGVQCIVGGLSGCGVVNGAASTAVKLDSLLFNTNGTTNVNDIQNAKVWYTGGSNLFSTGYVSPFPVTAGSDDYPTAQYGQTIGVPATNLDFVNGATSCFYLEYDTTYFWLTYDIKATATGGNFLDADFRGAAVGGTTGTCPSIPGSSTTPTTTVFTGTGSSQIDLPYCLPTYTVGTAWAGYTNNDYIQSVVLAGSNGTLINTNVQGGMPYPSNNNAGLPTGLGCYGSCDFTAHPPDYELWQTVAARTVTLIQGQSYTITVQAGTWFSSNYITAWIDYNRDGDFLDAGEQLFTPSNLAANASSNHTFTIPAAGYTGPTRLRVREVFANSTINPCQQYTYGEVEDFNIFISPNCPIGYKLWLGNTSNWHDPANWCGGVPAITDSAVVNRSLVPGGVSNRRYFPPTILNNANQANCNSLFISAQDTLLVNAPIPAFPALKVRTNLINNGRVEVQGGFSSSATFGTGTLSLATQTPFRTTTTDTRTQIIYSVAELTGAGLVAGDRLTGIQFNLWNKGSSTPFNGFTVSYALVPFDQHVNNQPFAGPFTTVYGPVAQSTVLGLNTLTLGTPIIWDGTSNLLIQYCFDNAATAGGTTDDRIFCTQTTGFRRTLITFSTSNAASGCALVPGAGVIDFFAAAQFRPNFTFLINRTYGKPVMNIQKDWLNNGTFAAGNSRVTMDSTVAQVLGGTAPTTFHEYEVNKGAATQLVTMQNDISVNDTLLLSQGCLLLNGKFLQILNPSPSTGVHTNFAAIGGPITRTNGFIISETPAALPTVSGVRWTVGTTPGWRVIPFGSSAAAPTAIPFTFDHKSGDLGVFSISTYTTPAANTPFPPTVTHLRGWTSTNVTSPDNSSTMVNRFWMTDKTGANPTTNLAFRWTDLENSVGQSSLNPPRAQPWRYDGTVSPIYEAWLRISNFAGIPAGSLLGTPTSYTQTTNIATGVPDSTRVVDWNWPSVVQPSVTPGTGTVPIGNYLPWALSNNNSPLPVELLDFRADIINKKVRLSWITASETNNDYFTVERNDATLDDDDFSFIAKVNSYMHNSNMMLSYEAWDHSPLPGLQYYRLKQTDLDGQYTYSDLEPVMFGNGASFDITNVYGYTETDGQFSVEFNYDSDLPVNAIITDASGRVVFKQDNIPAVPGANRLQVAQSLPRGIYFILLQNQEKSVNRKFFY